MRNLVSFSLASVFGFALVHCAADPTDETPPATPPTSETADGTAPDAGPTTSPDAESEADAAVDAAPDATPVEAGVCSADQWCQTPLPSDDIELQAVWNFGHDDAIAVGPAGAVQWNGKSWTAVSSPDVSLEGLNALWATGPTDIWGTEESSTRIVHGSRTAAGAAFQWSEITGVSFSFPLTYLRSTGPRDLWGLSRWPMSTVSLVHGVLPEPGQPGDPVWTTTALPIDAGWNFTLSGFAITENKEIWIGGSVSDMWGWPPPPDIAHVFHGTPPLTEDGEYTWEENFVSDGSLPTTVAGLWAPQSDDLWVITNLGTTYDPLTKPTVNYRRKVAGDGSAAWSSVPNNSSAYALAVWGSGKNDVWTVGTSGAIRRWDGTKWSTSRIATGPTPIFKDLAAIHGASADDIWAVGKGIALHRAPGGAP